MRAPTEHIKTLQRRIDFLKTREHKNSYDSAELGSLEWAIVNLQHTKDDGISLTSIEHPKGVSVEMFEHFNPDALEVVEIDIPVRIGDIVQIKPKKEMFGACMVTVTEVKSWGIQGYVQSAGVEGQQYVRVKTEDFEPTGGRAVWVVN